jgi:hypothetical protein
MKLKKALASIMATGLLLLAGTASADPAFTLAKPQVSGQLNYGIFTGSGDLNPYGLGLGVKGGYTLDSSIYVGGAFDYYFGESQDLPGGGSVKAHVWTLQGEVGYDLGVAPNIVVRPKGGIGLTSLGGKVCGNGGDVCLSDSKGYFSIAPGVQGIYSLDSFYLTADARFNIVFGTEDNQSAGGFLLGIGAGKAF